MWFQLAMRRVVLLPGLAAVIVLGPAYRSEASIPINQLGTPGTDPYDDIFRILNSNGSAGTGTVFGMRLVNANTLDLCIATADHVLRLGSLGQLGFRSINPTAGTMDPNAFNFTPASSATFLGGPTGSVDMAFIGATINLNSLTLIQRLLLTSLHPVPLTTAPANVPPTFNFTERGYGVTAAGPGGGFDFLYHRAVAAEQYGTQRFINNTVQAYQNNQIYNYFNPPIQYQYDSMTWRLRTVAQGAIPGEGYAMQGDSGAPILNSSNQMLGIFDFNTVAVFPNGDLGVNFGFEEGGVRMTQRYETWLIRRCQLYLGTPEPSTLVIGVVAGAGGLIFRLARRRKVAA
jgi:hypothetical protein